MKLDDVTKYLGIPIFVAAIYYVGYMNLLFHNTVLGLNPRLDLVTITIAGGDFYVGTIADTIKFATNHIVSLLYHLFTKFTLPLIILILLLSCKLGVQFFFKKKTNVYFYLLYICTALFVLANILLLLQQMRVVDVSDFLSIDKSSLDFNASSDLKSCDREVETYNLYLSDLKDFNYDEYKVINEYFNLTTSEDLEKKRLLTYTSIVLLLVFLVVISKVWSKHISFRLLVFFIIPNLLILPATFGVLGKSYYVPYVSFKDGGKPGEGYLLLQENNKKYIYQPHENFSILVMDKKEADTMRIEFTASPFDSKVIGDIAICCNKINYHE